MAKPAEAVPLSTAAAFVDQSNPPRIRVVVRKRPLNAKVR